MNKRSAYNKLTGNILIISLAIISLLTVFATGQVQARVHKSHQQSQTIASSTRSNKKHHRGRHSEVKRTVVQHARPRYAYPLDFFLPSPPVFDLSAYPDEINNNIRNSFAQGTAENYPPRALVKAGVIAYHPLHGGIFWRREPIRYIIMHSTETGNPQLGAVRIIDSWSSMGRRHPGAQYIVDRDGTTYQTVDPDLATVHVNIFKTLPGINNDNSVGIEMCHSGSQEYTREQITSVIKLVVYLQNHYHISNENIITHRYAQQGDHTDPVHFGWDEFIAEKNRLLSQAQDLKLALLNKEASSWQVATLPPAKTFMQIHRQVKAASKPSRPVVPKANEDRNSSIVQEAPLPLRGPFELDPGVAKLIEHNVQPIDEATREDLPIDSRGTDTP